MHQILVLINQNRIFQFSIRFRLDRNRIFRFPIRSLINRNRTFEKLLRLLIDRNRNSGCVPEFRFLIGFCSSSIPEYRHAPQMKTCTHANKHIQCMHTCLLLLTTAVHAHTGQYVCVSVFAVFFLSLSGSYQLEPDFQINNSVLINRKPEFLKPFRFLINRNRNSG